MALAAGTKLGPYEIATPIGKGGMGEVFRAVDTRLHRTVAIKLVSGEGTTDDEHRRRFLHEARAASALSHPNIVVLYDIANHEGIDFLVLEYVSGQTLKNLIPAHGMPVESVVSVGSQTASALAAAHSVGIVHRDIKPANLMLTVDQQVKVLDFGLAKVTPMTTFGGEGETETVLQMSTPGIVVGTVAYMSPEQTRGEKVDARSDIFSLGCVLYEAITGQKPFRGVSVLAILHDIAVSRPVPPSHLRAGLPRGLDDIIFACLAKNPDERPASAAALVQELKTLATPTGGHSVQRGETRKSIAVLPFRFRTPAAEEQFLSVALADSVANRLAATGKLLVRPTASVLRYAGQEGEWAQAARELNVDLVVEGAIQKLGSRLRVQVQAHRATDSVTLLSTRHDGTMDELFELQDRIADSVSDVFAPKERIHTESAVTSPTKNPLAFELYLRAVERLPHMDKFETGSAIEMLCQATNLDPDFAEGWGRLAQAYTQMGAHLDPAPKWFEAAERAIAKALELDPLQCHAQCARGQILWSPSRRFQNRAALRAMNAAVRIDPHRPDARQFRGAILFHLGFHEAAWRDCEEALLTNPRLAMGPGTMGTIALYQGDFEKAQDCYRRALDLDPALVLVHIFAPLAPLGLGRLDGARKALDRARQMVPDEPQIVSIEGLIEAQEGNFERAVHLADQALASKRSLTHTHHTWHYAAGIFAECGMRDRAMVELRRCAEMGLPNPRVFRSDPHLRRLQTDPEFQTFLSGLRREFDQYRAEFALDDESEPQ